jgi:hypothetical protein
MVLRQDTGPASRADTPLAPSVPIGLVIDLDLEEERYLDRDLQTDFALAEKVTDHLGEDAKPAAGCFEEFSKLLHVISPVDCVSSQG